MMMFLRPVASMALRKSMESREFIELRSITGWPGKMSNNCGPDITTEGFGFHRSEHRGHLEFLGDFGQQGYVVDHHGAICAGNAEEHLRLKVDEYNCRIFGRVGFVVLIHVTFPFFLFYLVEC